MIMRKMVLGRVLLAAVMLSCALARADEESTVADMQILSQAQSGDDQTMPVDDLFARVIEVAEAADDEDDLQAAIENDPRVQEMGRVLGSDIMVSSVDSDYCYLTPLICLWKSHAPDLQCIYGCIGLHGTGELTGPQQSECDFIVGCILFQNCLTLCITIIPHDLQPVVW